MKFLTNGSLKLNGSNRGFTLIELMLTVVIITVLITITYPKYVNLANKAKEADVKHVLGVVRSSVSVYYADNQGVYPDSLINGIVRFYSVPPISIPPNLSSSNPGHLNGTGEKNQLVADDDFANGAWLYSNGSVSINCTHLSTQNQIWSAY